MSDDQVLAFETDCHLFTGAAFPAPRLQSFIFEPSVTVGGFEFNKPMLLAVLGTVIVVGFFWAAFAQAEGGSRQAPVARRGRLRLRPPRDRQRIIGKKAGEKYVPLLVSLFFFVWIMNLWAVIPLAQFPVTSIFAYPGGARADRLGDCT